ncbi:hypothetical protein [Spirosoma endophyticum]|nr:hypothetical protein [Spirosoma endophyticum]
MNAIKLLVAMLLFIGVGSCRKKEVFPDLAKQIEGTYTITEANLTYQSSGKTTGVYNPKDSAQTGQITIQKLDALSANIHTVLKKQSGEVFFDDTFYCELSRDISNKGFIKFTALENKGGGYIVNDTQAAYPNYISVGTFSTYQGKKAVIAGSFTAKH